MSARNSTRLALITLALMTSAASAETPWVEGDVTQALHNAERSGKRTLVFVTASWCPSCQDLKKEVLTDVAHRDLLDRFERVRVDFDLEASHRWVRELVILGLPTVVVLKPDGTPVGRIRGYRDAPAWTKELEGLSGEEDRRAGLERAAQNPDANPETLLKCARLLLERGEEEEALKRLRGLGSSGDPEVAPNALFVLGRYFHRVKRDPLLARPVWREIALGFPESPFAPGAWWWYARAEAESGHVGSGARALLDAARNKPQDSGRVRRAAAYLKKHPQLRGPLRNELLDAIGESLRSTDVPSERATLEALRDQVRALRLD